MLSPLRYRSFSKRAKCCSPRLRGWTTRPARERRLHQSAARKAAMHLRHLAGRRASCTRSLSVPASLRQVPVRGKLASSRSAKLSANSPPGKERTSGRRAVIGSLLSCGSSKGSTPSDDKLESARLLYNGARYYDPETGRYVSSDPVGLMGGLNTYGYVGTDPLRYSDPTGLCWEDGRIGEIAGGGLLDAFCFWMCVVVPRLSPYRTPWSIQVIIMMI